MKCASCGATTDAATDTCLHCGRNLYALTLGSVLDERYEIQGMLGQGGMGVVYRAHDRDLDETVAIKVLRAEAQGSDEAALRMRSEIKLARRIRHRNVCAIHEFGHSEGRRFIAMEYVDGTSLRQLLRERGALPVSQAYDLAIQTAEGLDAIHEAGVIHRDLKAANVMVDRRGRVRLMDFGIAKPLQQDASGITATDQMVGTPEYMSPEQVRCERLDPRSDLYSFGILVFEMFSGDVPFRGLTPMSVLMAHLEQPPPLEGDRASRLPAPLVPVLRRALAKRREDRLGSAREMATLLRAARTVSCPDRRDEVAVSFEALGAVALEPAAVADEASTVTATPTPASPRTPTVPATARTRPAGGSSGPRRAMPTRVPRRPPPPWLLAAAGAAAAVAVLAGLASYLPFRGGFGPASPAASPSESLPSPASPTPEPPAPSSAPALSETAARTTDTQTVVPPPSPSPPPPRSAATPSRAAVTPTAAPRSLAAKPTPLPTATPEAPPSRQQREDKGEPVPSPPAPAVAPTPKAPPAQGFLKLRILPWAEVSVDDRPVGTTPLKPLSLAPGVYTVKLSHPDFRPLQKKVVIRSGDTSVLDVDLAEEAFPIRKED